MKRILWNITLASVITLVAYIALYALLGSILSGFKNPILSLLLIALMTTAAFGFFLLYTSKIRESIGEDEVIFDYKDREYISLADDCKLILKREAKTLICIAVIVFVCFALNTLDRLFFEKKMLHYSQTRTTNVNIRVLF